MAPLPEMGKWQKRLWPVYPHENKKFIPMVVIMFWVLFNYTIVRNIKDSLLVNAPYSSAHVLPWAKILVVTPASILFVLLYAKLSNLFSKDKLYYCVLIPFVLFFFLFGFVIYPARAFFNATPETIHAWQQAFPSLKDVIPMIGYWTFTLFYAMAELWGNIGAAILFWQFANEITPTSEAKRFYPIFGFWSNLGLVSAGLLLRYAEPLLSVVRLPTGEKDFTGQAMLLCGCVTAGGFFIGMMYWWMKKHVLSDPQYAESAETKSKKASKPKLSIGESIKFLMKSKYLGYITVLVLAYGITINVVEVSWKDSLGEYFRDPVTGLRNAAAYGAFTGNLFISTGILTMVLILFSQNILRIFGWKFSAVITPWVTLITGGLFFAFLVFQDSMMGIAALLDMTPLYIAIWFGLAQNAITKASKYALFDPTKEMAYIPLDEESKVKGKAAIDVVGGRAGKAGGGVLNIFFHKLFPASAGAFFSSMGVVLIVFCSAWIWAVGSLSKLYHEKLKENEDSGN